MAQTTIKGQDVERALRPGLRHSQSIVLRRKQSFGATLGPVTRGAETRAAGSYKWEPTLTKSPPIRSKVARRRQSKKAPELHPATPRVCAKEKVGAGGESFTRRKHKKQQKKKESSELKLQHVK